MVVIIFGLTDASRLAAYVEASHALIHGHGKLVVGFHKLSCSRVRDPNVVFVVDIYRVFTVFIGEIDILAVAADIEIFGGPLRSPVAAGVCLEGHNMAHSVYRIAGRDGEDVAYAVALPWGKVFIKGEKFLAVGPCVSIHLEQHFQFRRRIVIVALIEAVKQIHHLL